MGRFCLGLAALVIGMGPAGALGSIQVVGDPTGLDVWTQGFRESGVGTFDFVAVKIVSPDGSLDTPALGGFNRSGWNAEDFGSGIIAVAHGPGVGDMTFEVGFSGAGSGPLAFVFVAFRQGTLVEEARAEWDGSAWLGGSGFPSTQEWSLGVLGWGPADILEEASGSAKPAGILIPEPGSVAIWVVLVGLFAVCGWRGGKARKEA